MPSTDPIATFRRLLARARRAGVSLPEAAVVATADRRGRPSARFVLVKQVDERGFVFYTDSRSRKGRELLENPHAALVVYWDAIGKQVRVEGRVSDVGPLAADAYWTTRPRQSRLAASASTQTSILRRPSDLVARTGRLRNRYRGREIPRPREWAGFRIAPEQIEIWTRRAHRLHKRELFVRSGGGWRRTCLQP